METLADLGRLQDGNGPFLSVYVPTEQWPMLRTELVEQGAPQSALDLVDQLVNEADGETLAAVTNADTVFIREWLTEPLIYGRGQWADAADLVPIIKDRQERGAERIDDDDERRSVKTEVAEETVELLERFKAEPHADGIAATRDALDRGAVEVLLVRDDRDERRDVPREDAAVLDALVRDALKGGASVHVIPASGPVTEGVGALLR